MSVECERVYTRKKLEGSANVCNVEHIIEGQRENTTLPNTEHAYT